MSAVNFLPSATALRCFDASARLGSLTKAAAEVHLTQGAVSQQILALEQKLGAVLFIRSKSGLKLTPAGQTYWSEIAVALRQIERATQNMMSTKGDGGTLNVSVASTFGTYWLMPRLRTFVTSHPEITINLSTQIGPIDFANSTSDAAIEFSSGAKPNLHAELIMPLRLRPYCASKTAKTMPSKKHLVALLQKSALIRHTTVLAGWGGWLEAVSLSNEIDTKQANGGPQYDLLSMALNAVIEGFGIALLPDYLVEHALGQQQITALSKVYWTSEKAYYLRYPESKTHLVSLQKFEQWLLRQRHVAAYSELVGQ
jgi:LysR family transcriptional regulator, glycine cleavage system transcriptional activator